MAATVTGNPSDVLSSTTEGLAGQQPIVSQPIGSQPPPQQPRSRIVSRFVDFKEPVRHERRRREIEEFVLDFLARRYAAVDAEFAASQTRLHVAYGYQLPGVWPAHGGIGPEITPNLPIQEALDAAKEQDLLPRGETWTIEPVIRPVILNQDDGN